MLQEGGSDQRAFDDLIEVLIGDDAATFVIDNGAYKFIPLWNYFLENSVNGYLRESRKRVFVHTVITGGQALSDTQRRPPSSSRNGAVHQNGSRGDKS